MVFKCPEWGENILLRKIQELEPREENEREDMKVKWIYLKKYPVKVRPFPPSNFQSLNISLSKLRCLCKDQIHPQVNGNTFFIGSSKIPVTRGLLRSCKSILRGCCGGGTSKGRALAKFRLPVAGVTGTYHSLSFTYGLCLPSFYKDLSSCNRDHMAPTPYTTYYLTL